MKQISSVEETFKWFLINIYSSLPPDRKKGKLKTAWRDYTYDQGISQKRMVEILSEFGDVDILVRYRPR